MPVLARTFSHKWEAAHPQNSDNIASEASQTLKARQLARLKVTGIKQEGWNKNMSSS